MGQAILVATDGSARSVQAVDAAISLAGALKTELVACAAIPPYDYYVLGSPPPEAEAQVRAASAAAANQALSKVEQAAKAAGIACTAVVVDGEAPDRAILQVADQHDCEIIVMASRGHGVFTSMLLGSTTQKVLAQSTRPVLVVR